MNDTQNRTRDRRDEIGISYHHHTNRHKRQINYIRCDISYTTHKTPTHKGGPAECTIPKTEHATAETTRTRAYYYVLLLHDPDSPKHKVPLHIRDTYPGCCRICIAHMRVVCPPSLRIVRKGASKPDGRKGVVLWTDQSVPLDS